MGISGSIPNLIGGLSQQPPAVRLENAAQETLNASLSVVSGVGKRPPTQFQADIGSLPTSTLAYYAFDRQTIDGVHVTIADGVIKVFGPDGTPQTVNTLVADGYLTSPDPEKDFEFAAIGDSVFILNKTVVTAGGVVTETRTVAPTDYNSVIIKNSVASAQYVVYVNGVIEATHTTGTSPGSTDQIAEALKTALNSAGHVTVRYGNVLSITNASPGGTVRAEPSSVVSSYRDKVQRFTDLGPVERPGRMVEVIGSTDEPGDSYWVFYDSNQKLWLEQRGWNGGAGFTKATMPHILREVTPGVWEYTDITWKNREAGDDESNPWPSFYGITINNIYFDGDRFCLLSGENLIQTAIGDYEQFWRTTTTQLLPSDRVDITAMSPNKRRVDLRHAYTFNDTTYLFSDGIQFKLGYAGDGSGDLELKPSTYHPCSPICAPVGLGRNVAFCGSPADAPYSSILEFFVDGNGEAETEELTKQVPSLIKTGVYKIISDPSVNQMFVLSSGKRLGLEVYSYYWGARERIQSAWTSWEIGGSSFLGAASAFWVHNGGFLKRKLYLVVTKGTRLVLLKMDLEEVVEPAVDGMMDLRVTEADCTFAWDGVSTTINLPYPTKLGESFIVQARSDGPLKLGGQYQAASGNGLTSVTLKGDWRGESFYIGRAYYHRHSLSPIYMRDKGGVPIQDGRLQIRYLSLHINRASTFYVEVKPVDRPISGLPGTNTYMHQFPGNSREHTVEAFSGYNVYDGEWRIPIKMPGSKLDVTIVNEGPFNARVTSIDWEGAWRPRTGRMR